MFNQNQGQIPATSRIISSKVKDSKLTIVTEVSTELSESDLVNQRGMIQRRMLDIKNQMKMFQDQYEQAALEITKIDEFIEQVQTSMPIILDVIPDVVPE